MYKFVSNHQVYKVESDSDSLIEGPHSGRASGYHTLLAIKIASTMSSKGISISFIDSHSQVAEMRFRQAVLTKRNSRTHRDSETPAFSSMRATGQPLQIPSRPEPTVEQ